MTRRHRLAVVAAAAVVLAACNGPYDFTGPVGADMAYVDSTGAWRVIGQADPIWVGPTIAHPSTSSTTGRYPVPGNYDGEGRWEPAMVDLATGTWSTAGERGTFVVPLPPDPTPAVARTGRVVAVPADYDGDGDTDPAYFVEETGEWHIEGGTPFVFGRRSDDPTTPVFPGYPASVDPSTWTPLRDVVVPGDYDGDGDADPAVYRMNNGDLLVHGAAEPTPTNLPYGFPIASNQTADPGDEIVVWRFARWSIDGEPPAGDPPSDGYAPVPADYDGDGIAELAVVVESPSRVWRAEGSADVPPPPAASSTNAAVLPVSMWATLFSYSEVREKCGAYAYGVCPGTDDLQVSKQYGWWMTTSGPNPDFTTPPGSVPVMDDYDGDANDEYAGYDPSTGQWVTAGAGCGMFTYAAPPDVDADPSTSVYPVPLDIDGDGDTDPAFYRDTDATWHIEGVAAPIQFGRTTATTPRFGTTPVHDIPAPGDYDGDGDDDLAVFRIDSGDFAVRGGATVDPGWPAGHPAIADLDGDGDDELGILAADGTGQFHRAGATATTPFGPMVGVPLPEDWDGDGDDELGVLQDGPSGGGQRVRVPHRDVPGAFTVAGTLDVGPMSDPAVGRPETHANRAFVKAYVATCVTPASPPASCP